MIEKPSPYSGMIDDDFEFFIRTTYPSDFESMTAKYPDQSLEQLWPEQWQAFQYMSAKFIELVEENARVERERNSYRDKADMYQRRVIQCRSLISQHFKIHLSEPEHTLKALERSLIGCGE